MKTLQSLLFACLFAFVTPLWAQAAVPDVPEIAPAPAAAGKCDKCKEAGMGRMAGGGMACCKGKQERAGGKCDKCKEGGMGMMAHGDMEGMGGKGCCGGMGGGDSAALERRIAELEKRLDLMQQLLVQPRKR